MNRILNASSAIENLESTLVHPNELHFARDMKRHCIFLFNNMCAYKFRTTSQSSIASSVETLEQLDKTIGDVGSSNSNIANDAIAQVFTDIFIVLVNQQI